MDTHIYAYVNDLVVTTKDNTRLALEAKLNRALAIIHAWTETHKLKMFTRKCCYMVFGPKMPRNPTIRLGNCNIKRVQSFKYLGLHIDDKLTFQLHIKKVIEKAKNVSHSLKRTLSRIFDIKQSCRG